MQTQSNAFLTQIAPYDFRTYTNFKPEPQPYIGGHYGLGHRDSFPSTNFTPRNRFLTAMSAMSEEEMAAMQRLSDNYEVDVAVSVPLRSIRIHLNNPNAGPSSRTASFKLSTQHRVCLGRSRAGTKVCCESKSYEHLTVW